VHALAVAELDPRAQLVPREADLAGRRDPVAPPARAAAERAPMRRDLDAPAESRVERDDVAVLALDLEIHLEAAELAQAQLGLRDECASDARRSCSGATATR
jgi:hypothetical protein